jgi:hypothetical protein
MSASWAHGISFFAGALLIVGGGAQALQALAAIVNDKYFVVAPNYLYTFDLTAWGWIHLLIGLAFVAIGICLLLGQGWGLDRWDCRCRDLRLDQLHLAALLALLGRRPDRDRHPHYLGPGIGSRPAKGRLSRTRPDISATSA